MNFGENHGIGCSKEIQNLHINPADSEFQIPLARFSTGLQISAPGIPLDSGIPGSPYLEFHWTPHLDLAFHRTLEFRVPLTGNSTGLRTPDLAFHRTPEFRAPLTRNSTGFHLESSPDLEFRWNSTGIPGLFLLGKCCENPLKSHLRREGWQRCVWMRNVKNIRDAGIGTDDLGMSLACEFSVVGSFTEGSGWGVWSVAVLCDFPSERISSARIFTSPSFRQSEPDRRGGFACMCESLKT
ncbi:hypothetical protein ACROYT_G037570 [Oculina patagonica]